MVKTKLKFVLLFCIFSSLVSCATKPKDKKSETPQSGGIISPNSPVKEPEESMPVLPEPEKNEIERAHV